jgi:hypothetical protein
MHEILIYILSPVVTALLGICAYFLGSIHKDFKALQHSMEETKVSMAKSELRLDHIEGWAKKVDNYIAKST